MFNFERVSNNEYVIKSDNKVTGNLVKDDDGYFYYWPTQVNEKCWDSLTLKIISKKLDELNKDWDREVNKFFSAQVFNLKNNKTTVVHG